MPILRGPPGTGGIQRSGDFGTGDRGGMEHGTERAADGGGSYVRKPEESMVGMPRGPHLACGGVFQNRSETVRLSGMRGPGERPASAAYDERTERAARLI